MGMFFFNKQRYKPVYKKFITLRTNVLNNKKIFNFKRKKWKIFLFHLRRKSRRYRRKPYSIFKFHVPWLRGSGNSFKKQYRSNFQNKKRLNIFYGGFLKKQLKPFLKSKQKKLYNFSIIKLFEKRLDSVLFRSYFTISLKNSGQLISHGVFRVNGKVVTKKSYLLNEGDIISVTPKYHRIIYKNLKRLSYENRLDFILRHTHFCSTKREAKWYVKAGIIMVNNKLVKKVGRCLKKGDVISINPRRHNDLGKKFKKIRNRIVWYNFRCLWPIPPSYLLIKYKTMQIVFGEKKIF